MADSVLPVDIPSFPTTSNVEFKSRVSVENRIVDALMDPSVYSIGIWGIGGIGKTVMVEKIRKMMLNKHVVMVNVCRYQGLQYTQQQDLLNIQSQIAAGLGLTLSEESPIVRRRELYQRLMAEKGVLIILDDLLERLNFEEIGILSQSTRASCKLILTSRNKDTLTSSGVLIQNIFQLEILTKDESWKFFKDLVGIDVDDGSHDELVQIAKKVERKCTGLPLVLKIFAGALKGRSIYFWNDAVQGLKEHVPSGFTDTVKEVYSSLLFSSKALEGKERTDLFLLCCLFPEDYFISIEELLRCVIGLGIFKESKNLTEARQRVKIMLNIFLSQFLLIIKGNQKHDNFYVRMYDVFREAVKWVEWTENKGCHLFLIKHGVNEWPIMEADSSYSYTCISLLFSHHGIIFPESIVFPKLEFLRLDFVERSSGDYHVKLPENFFDGMSGLRVFEASHIESLPPSMGQLNNLRTLSLQRCKIFETVLVLGKLINLEMLSLRNCEFQVLPTEIGNLRKLKQMHILECGSLRKIEIGVISGLECLEELVIWDSFDNWDAVGGGEQDVSCLSELNVLKNLTTVKIKIRNYSHRPKSLSRFKS